MAKHTEIGERGEFVAIRHLEKLGHAILDQNYQKPWGEIDIISTSDGILHFTEVKATASSLLRPEEHMTAQKLQRQRRILQTYLSAKRIPVDQSWQYNLAIARLDMTKRLGNVEMLWNVVI